MDASTFIGDNAVQAYNYRLCLTKNPNNKVPITKPKNYDRNEYASIIDDVWTGRHTQAEMVNVTLEMLEANKKHIAKGNPTMIPGDKWGLGKVVYAPKSGNRVKKLKFQMKKQMLTTSMLLLSHQICLKRTGHGLQPVGHGVTSLLQD